MRLLRRPPVRLAVDPAARAYLAGEPITVRVTAVGQRDVSIRAASAGMIAKIRYRDRAATDAYVFVAPPAPRPLPPPAIVTGAAVDLSFPATLPAGGTVEREAVVPNWACTPSGGLEHVGVEYWLRARLTLGDGATVLGESQVRLDSRRWLNQDVEGAALAYRHHQVETWPVRYQGDWDITLHLPDPHARHGQTLRGVLQVSPHQAARARRILVSLQMILARARPPMPSVMRAAEYGGDVESPVTHARRVTAVTLATRTRLTGPRDFPFTIPLPGKACPTILTRYLAVRWYLRGWVQDDSLQWQVSDSEINFYTALD